MAKRDYYEILQITQTASDTEIKTAFRRLAKECHPDRNRDDDEAEHRFKEINEAYEILKDPEKRAAYDRFGHAAFENGMGQQDPHGFGTEFSASMSEIFEDLFGGGRRTRSRSGQQRGNDLRYNMEISLADAYHGKKAEIQVQSGTTCPSCSGSGAKSGTRPEPCSTCNGQGKVRASQGFFTIERPCPSCHGQGMTIKDPCPSCSGSGRVIRERTLSVNIPPGVEDGQRIRLSGEGEAGVRGGPPGDLYIFLSTKQHEFFQRDGSDLFCRVPVSMITAALGGQVEVPTVDGGRTRVKIPEGTRTGKQFRLRGKGMPILRTSTYGDMYIQVEVETPQNLDRQQKDILREFELKSTDKTNPDAAGFMARVQEASSGRD